MWKEYEAAVVAASGAKAKTAVRSVVPIQQVFENCKNFSRDSEKAKALNKKSDAIHSARRPAFFCRWEHGFSLKLIAYLEPCYTIPSRRFFSDVSLPALYDNVATKILNLIA